MAVLPRFVLGSFVMLLGVGCAAKQPPRKLAEGENTSPALSIPQEGVQSPGTSNASTTTIVAAPPAEPFAKAFLDSLQRGDVKLEQVSPAFLKVIAEPGILQSDIDRGYDAFAATNWFKTASGVSYESPKLTTDLGNATLVVGNVQGGGRYVLRFMNANGAWKLDWFQRLPANASPVEMSDIAARMGAECAIAAIIAAKDDGGGRFAAATFTPELQRRLGPPFGSDAARGYNLGGLRVSIHSLADGAKSYTLTPKGNDTYVADLSGGRKPHKATLKMVKGSTPGQWLVSDLQAE